MSASLCLKVERPFAGEVRCCDLWMGIATAPGMWQLTLLSCRGPVLDSSATVLCRVISFILS